MKKKNPLRLQNSSSTDGEKREKPLAANNPTRSEEHQLSSGMKRRRKSQQVKRRNLYQR